MPSTLSWIDHDPAERERMQRILALFQERDTRDELGLGAIRDSFADQLFPGTSTIQTRLRYMLFVPWIYQRIEREHVASERVAGVARHRELALTPALIPSGDFGIFGRTAGGTLKRLPSSVYWAGMATWGILRFPGPQSQYHRSLDEIYRVRRAARSRADEDLDGSGTFETWHPKLPEPPGDFPNAVDFALTVEEAGFLRDRIATTHPRSLLAFLVVHARPASTDFPWMHPDFATFPLDGQELLEHARCFSESMEGAAILYNLMLAERAEQPDLIEQHRRGLAEWSGRIDLDAIGRWDLDRFWVLASGTRHTITNRARQFVTGWIDALRRHRDGVVDAHDPRSLVRRRETMLKGGRSRFTNERALEQWGGYAGLSPMNFRWATVSTFLSDLASSSERE